MCRVPCRTALCLNMFQDSTGAADLQGVKYAVLALGSSIYPDFCQYGIDVDKWLPKTGAEPILPLYKIDDAKGYTSEITVWLELVERLVLPRYPLTSYVPTPRALYEGAPRPPGRTPPPYVKRARHPEDRKMCPFVPYCSCEATHTHSRSDMLERCHSPATAASLLGRLGFGLWAYLPESEEGLRGPRSAALGKLGSGAPHSPFGHAASGRGTRLLL